MCSHWSDIRQHFLKGATSGFFKLWLIYTLRFVGPIWLKLYKKMSPRIKSHQIYKNLLQQILQNRSDIHPRDSNERKKSVYKLVVCFCTNFGSVLSKGFFAN